MIKKLKNLNYYLLYNINGWEISGSWEYAENRNEGMPCAFVRHYAIKNM